MLPLCLFQWSDKPCVPHLLQRDSYYVYTQQELKEKLYQEIISYFDKGKVERKKKKKSRRQEGGKGEIG